MAQLRELVGRVMSEPLDFDRPLWQLYLIEGLEGGRARHVIKTHHALVDGVSAVDVGTIILDPNPEGTEMEIAGRALGARRAEPGDAAGRAAPPSGSQAAAHGAQGGARAR